MNRVSVNKAQALKDVISGKLPVSTLEQFAKPKIEFIPYDDATEEEKLNYRHIKNQLLNRGEALDKDHPLIKLFKTVPDLTKEDLDLIGK
jgi:hypothetical protein